MKYEGHRIKHNEELKVTELFFKGNGFLLIVLAIDNLKKY